MPGPAAQAAVSRQRGSAAPFWALQGALDREPAERPAVQRIFHQPPDAEVWSGVYLRMLRESLALFAMDVLGLQIGQHLVEWSDLVHSHRRIALMAARDHSKSTWFSYAYPIWRAWSEPGCDVYIFSSTADGAMDFLDTIVYGNADQTLPGLVDIPQLAHLVPTRDTMRLDPRQRLNKQDVRLTNGSRIRAVGYGKKIRGRHPRYVVCDDILNDEDMYSDTVRNKHIAYFKSAIVNLVHPKGQIIVVGTPFHVADLWGFLRKNSVYAFRSYPALIREKNRAGKVVQRALFPWRWSVKDLLAKRKEIGPVAFTREILVQPISDETSLFPSHLFPRAYDESLCLRPSKEEIRARRLSVFAGVDIALSANVGADYFVIFVIGVDPQGNHYIVDIIRRHGLPYHDQLALIEATCSRYLVDLCHIEANQAQRVWSDEMKRSTDAPVKEFVTTAANKYPLDKGVPGLRILLENEKYIVPRGDDYSIELTDIWQEECQAMGFANGKLQGVGAHDDTVMAWWMAVEARKRGGFGFSNVDADDPEVDDDDDDEGSWEDEMLGTPEERQEAQDALGAFAV